MYVNVFSYYSFLLWCAFVHFYAWKIVMFYSLLLLMVCWLKYWVSCLWCFFLHFIVDGFLDLLHFSIPHCALFRVCVSSSRFKLIILFFIPLCFIYCFLLLFHVSNSRYRISCIVLYPFLFYIDYKSYKLLFFNGSIHWQ